MNQILPYPLWLGHAGDGRNFPALFAAGIEALVDLAAEEAVAQTPRTLLHCRFPMLDGQGNRRELLSLATSTIESLLRLGIPTLICCSAGMSRSPAMAAIGLALIRDEPPQDCLSQVLTHHPGDVSPGLWAEVMAFLTRERQARLTAEQEVTRLRAELKQLRKIETDRAE